MALWKQILISLCLLGLTGFGAILWLPGARPLLESAGLSGPMERAGLIRAARPETAGDGTGPAGSAARGVPVIALAPRQAAMDQLVAAIGTTRGIRSVAIASDRTGRVTALDIASGDRVTAGARLVQIDDNAARIAVDRARVALDHARQELDRLTRLERSGSGTVLQRQDAELALRNAELELRDSDYQLSQHRITAPIAGWIGILTLEPGDLIAAGTQITTIEDRARLLVDFRVPERLVTQISVGDPVTAAPLAEPGRQLSGQITALDNRVEAASRTLKVQAVLDNRDDRLRAGMALEVQVRLAGEPRPSVDPMAIQWGNAGPYVWVARGGLAVRMPVRILQRTSDAVLVGAVFEPGDLVVTEGLQTLRPGTEVNVTNAGPGG